MIVEGDSNKLVTNVLIKSRQEAEAFLAMEKKICEREVANTKNKASNYISDMEEKARQEVALFIKTELTKLDIYFQREYLRKKDHIFEDIFLQAYLHLRKIRENTQYHTILEGWITQAIDVLEEPEFILEIGAADEAFVRERYPDNTVTLSSEDIIGVIICAFDGRKRFDNTVKARLLRYKETLKAELAHILEQ